MQLLVSAGFLVLALFGAPAFADPVADFYKGKQIQFVIRSGVGGGYDLYARVLGRHIGKHIPGNPQVIPINMPGGGGIKAANYVANIAPKDGTILTIVSQGLPVDQALGINTGLEADLRNFNWLGNMSSHNQVSVVWHTSKTQNWEDALKRETVMGTTGAGSISTQVPAVYNNVLGAKFKLVVGYADGADVNLAMERGEVEARATNPWVSYKATTPHLVEKKMIKPIVQIGMTREPDLPDVPLMRDLAKTPEQKEIVDFISRAVAVGRPIATTPGVPAERVAALRKAFDATLKDPAFIAETEKQRMEIRAMSGQELAQLVNDIIGAPPATLEKVKLAIVPKDTVEAPKK
ncbi:MAG TPA: tripartite tricarboxylate transporter substrate-binding protein [Xanthobacteraceae bacterium]|nr:tripartite tricarboxylate transporter substrate-binding protein [Xanthobacteraceae bacterium]